ncbi:MAG: hypothetical protein HY820_39235 [Acidobacteria bacterium]|nr:hypothetical protein [Acidobacteriota bacterium]
MKDHPMRKPVLISCLTVVLLLIGAVVLHAEEMTGWVTDLQCAKAGQFTGADHKQHIIQGKPPVFVNESDKKILAITNPDKVMSRIGEKVKLTGTMKNNEAIEVQSITSARPIGN